MKERNKMIRLGIFVIACFVIFLLVIYNIGSRQNVFGSNFQISSYFHNVSGLKPGNNVRYAGINVGSVKNIMIINDSTLQVFMNLDVKVQDFLKKDAIASIGSDGLVGNMIVNISPGAGLLEAVEDGDIIQSYSRVQTEDMMVRLSQTNENIALLSLGLLEVVQDINSGRGSLYAIINDSTMAQDLRGSMRSLRQTTSNLNRLTQRVQDNLTLVEEGEGLLGYLLRDTSLPNQITSITENIDSLIGQRTAPILNNLEVASDDLQQSTNALKLLIDEINLNQGLAGTVLKDSTVAADLKQTMDNLTIGTELFNENMKAMRENFLFRRYFKKQEKELKKAQKKDLKSKQ